MNRLEKIKILFSDAYVDINKNHDEAFSVIKKYFESKKELPVIVNYDSHSDIYINYPPKYLTLANWVSYCLYELNVREFYWVIPNYFLDEENAEKGIQEGISDNDFDLKRHFLFIPEKMNEINKQEFLYNKNSKEIIGKEKIDYINLKCKKLKMAPIIKENNYKKVTFYILPLNKIDILKGKDVILSVDADAFCNTGHDTYMNMGNFWIDSEQLEKEYDILLNTLYENKIHPVCVSLTRSPGYFPKKYEKSLMSFFEEIKNAGIDTISQ